VGEQQMKTEAPESDEDVIQLGKFDLSEWNLDIDIHAQLAEMLSHVLNTSFVDRCEIHFSERGVLFDFWEDGVGFLAPWSRIDLGIEGQGHPTVTQARATIAAARERLDRFEKCLNEPEWVEENCDEDEGER
jgi:hypothetical protein